jgi:hypothetical protein
MLWDGGAFDVLSDLFRDFSGSSVKPFDADCWLFGMSVKG